MIHGTGKRPLAVALLLGLAACEQGEGEPCQITRDCADGLVCVGGEERSTCEEPGSDPGRDGEDAAAPDQDASLMGDAATPDDAAAPDAAMDAAMSGDAAADDAAADEDAGA